VRKSEPQKEAAERDICGRRTIRDKELDIDTEGRPVMDTEGDVSHLEVIKLGMRPDISGKFVNHLSTVDGNSSSER